MFNRSFLKYLTGKLHRRLLKLYFMISEGAKSGSSKPLPIIILFMGKQVPIKINSEGVVALLFSIAEKKKPTQSSCTG